MSSSLGETTAAAPLAYPSDATLSEILLDYNLNNTPDDKPAIIDGASGRVEYTYGSLRQGVRVLAAHFANDLQFESGDVVAVLSFTKNYFPLAVHAILAVGGVVSAFNPLYEVGELVHALRLARPKHIIVEEVLHERLIKALHIAERFIASPTIYIWDATSTQQRAGTINVPHIIQHGQVTFLRKRLGPGEASKQLAFICFSSGTSGLVKGVALSHGNVVANIFQQHQGLSGMFTPETVMVLAVPFFHILGLSGFCCQYVCQGAPIVVFKRFDLLQLLQSIRRDRITHINVVPPLALEFLRNPAARTADYSSVKALINAAAPLKKEVADQLCSFMGCVVTQWYGMTEASPSVASQREDEVRIEGTIGRMLPGMDVKIVDESGQECPLGTSGELLIRGPNIMQGYIDHSGLNRNILNGDGYFSTGDIGYMDAKGYLFLVDRLKEMIKVKGNQVAPAELEAVLLTHPKVLDAAVCGIESPDEGTEYPIAYISTDVKGESEQKALLADVRSWVDSRVTRYKRLKGGVHLLPQIPRNASGKLLRRLLPANQAKSSVSAANTQRQRSEVAPKL